MKSNLLSFIFLTMAVSLAVAVEYETTSILGNGGFETGDFTSWHTANNVSITSSQVADGSYALQCDTIGVSEIVHDGMSVVEGESVLVMADYMVSASAATITASSVKVRFYGDSGFISEGFTDMSLTGGTWSNISTEHAVPAGAHTADVYIRVDCDAEVYVDNVGLFEQAPPTYNMENNLIQNGDAESAVDFENWYHSGAPFGVMCRIDSVSAGTSSFELNNTSNVYVGCDLRSLTVPVEPNEPLLLRFSYKTLPGFNLITPDGLRAQGRFFSDAGAANWISEEIFLLAPTDGNWVEVEQEITAHGNSAIEYIDILFAMNLFGAADGIVRFDDIELYNTRCPMVPDEELLENGGFETGDFTFWHTTNNVSVTSTVSNEGTYALQCDITGVSEIVHDGVSVTAGGTVFMSVDYMVSASATVLDASSAKVRFYGDSGFISEDFIDMSLTGGMWQNLSSEVIVPEGAHTADIYIRVDSDALVYVDPVSLRAGISQCIKDYDFSDLEVMAAQWLNNDFQPLLPDNTIEDFESYTTQSQLDAVWAPSSGSYAETGSSTVTLIADSLQTHGGNYALRWDYDNTGSGRVWSEFHTILSSAIDFSQYNEIHIWMNRHSGNSTEELLYVKFYNGSILESNILAESLVPAAQGSSSSPTGWSKWVVDLDDLIFVRGATSKADLDNVVGYFFGVVGDASTQGLGTGTIDFDDIVLVNTTPNCGSTAFEMDLNDDCEVNFEDFAVLADRWIGG